ncbi:Wzy polymerase domain-containing protein [Halomonas beimenensis]|uniref:Lipid A core-O-antigen ligase n=1 Tax=Halomonas beimenensis TaxID=475662 RepID=A0A291P6X7_9GAMM|nr:Wzy polymerase domain-containing protein [Halomonas beimenensis]ATJ82644.1 lipid A core-O-antigen ligase [Halomonas beimenensis]
MTQTSAPNRRLIAWFIGTTIFTFTVLMHVTFPNLGGTGLRMPHNAAVWMGFGVMMAIAMWPATRGVIHYSSFHIGLGLLLLALWLPFLWTWNEASLIALPRMLGVTAGGILLLGLAQLQLTQRDWWWLGFAILLGALLETLLSYAQLYWLEPGNWLGYNVNYQYPYGIFQQKNVLASFLVTGLAVSAWLIIEAKRTWERGVTLLAPLFMPAILWFAASVIGWLTAAIVIPLLLAYLWSQHRNVCKWWAGALVIGALLAYLLWNPSEGSLRSAESVASTSGSRWYVLTHSLRMILENPFLGWGYGRFQHDFLYSFADWRAAQPINQPAIVEPYIWETFSHPHNELLFWGVEGGLLPMLVLLVFGVWLLWRTYANGPKGHRLLLAALLLPLTLHSMTELPFYHSQASWLGFILLAGMVASQCYQTRLRDNRYTFGIRVGSLVATPVLLIFMVTHLQTLWKVKTHVASQGLETGTLSDVINPLGISNTLEFLVMSQQLNKAASLGLEASISGYLTWAREFAHLEPSPPLFSNIIQAEKLLDTSSQGVTTIDKAHDLFPASNFLQP